MRLDTKRKLAGLAIIQAIAAAGLFLAPWALDFIELEQASLSAWATAGAIIVLAALVSADEPVWAGWGTLLVGLWAVLATVVLDFAASVYATWAHLAAGGVVMLAAVAMLWLTSRPAGHAT